MFAAKVPDCFQNVQKTDYVGVDVGVGIFKRVANARLCGQMNDPVGLCSAETPDRLPLCRNVDLRDAGSRIFTQPR